MIDLDEATPQLPVRLGAYDVTGLLGEGGMGKVYEAVEREHDVRVALKTLSHMAPESLLRFKGEFRSVAGISHPNLVPLYELRCEGDLWFFTMERIDGTDFLTGVRGPASVDALEDTHTVTAATTVTVAQHALRGAVQRRPRPGIGPSPALPPSMPRLRDALAQLVRGVHALHEAGLVHLDLKPSNVLVDRAGKVTVLDFGLIQAIRGAPPSLSQSGGAPEPNPRGTMPDTPRSRTIRGTPAWMAPEQFVGEGVGEAADWYAVGLMLYQALTGIPAFPPATITAIWYAKQHLPPSPPHQVLAGVPPDLSALCAALLQPDPSERPTGAALLDLVSGDAERQARVATQLVRPDFLGRDEERRQLREAFRRSRERGGVVVHVTGPSGMGKTALLRSFGEEVQREGALVLTGRCYERETVPFKAFDGIVDDLAAELSAREAAELVPILPRKIDELGRVFPVLATIPLVASRVDAGIEGSWGTSVMELRRRAVQAFGELLQGLGARQPVVLLVDDLQWADADSVDVLQKVLSAAPRGVLVAASFRREEAGRSAALAPYLELVQSGGVAAELVSIDVEALPPASAEKLASATLRALGTAPEDLAAAIAAEAGGIPFFVEELAHYVAHHGERDAGGRPSMKGVALETVLARRVQELPSAERALVETLSVANSPIPLSVWFTVAGVGSGALRALWALRGNHFVKSTGASADDRIELHHDRMRESVLSYMPEEQIVDYHLRLGRALASRCQDDASPWLFDAVRHLGEAADRLEGAERIQAAALDLRAGRRARQSAAFPLAFDCFTAGIRLLDEGAWDHAYQLALDLHSGAAECAYLSGAWEAVDRHVDIVRDHGRTILDQLVAREVQIDACIARSEYAAAVEAALPALRLLDVDLPESPGDAEIGAAFQAATESLARIGPDGLLALPLADEPRSIAAMRLLSRISSAAYFARPALLPIIACQVVATSVARGLSPATPYALSVYGIVLNALGMLREAHAWGGVALKLLDRVPDRSLEARTRHVVHDLVCVFTVPLASTLDSLRDVVDIGKDTGDLEYAAYAAHAWVHNAFYAGRPLATLLEEAASLGAFMRGYEQVNALHVHEPFEQALRGFLGRTPDPASLGDDGFSEEAALEVARALGSRSAQCIVRLLMGMVRYHFGAEREASRLLAEARPFLDGVASTWHVPMFHQYAALAIWALPASERAALVDHADESLAALRRFAEHGPENFAHRVSLIEAEKARATGDPGAAVPTFERAVAGAAANGFLCDEGLAHELLARCLRAQGDAGGAALHLTAARDAYARWGALAKLHRLIEPHA